MLRRSIRIVFTPPLMVVFMLCGRASAAPAITSLAGTLSPGQSVTITGSNFGSKSQASPVIWDNFENGTTGVSIRSKMPVIGPAWSVGGVDASIGATYDPKYDAASSRPNSQKHALFDFTNPAGPYSRYLQYFASLNETYFTFWWRFEKVSPLWSRNLKPWYVYGNNNDTPAAYSGFGSPAVGDGYYRPQVTECCSAPPSSQPYTPTGGYAGNPADYGNQINVLDGHWVRFEVYLKQGDPGVANGNFQSWILNSDLNSVTHNFNGANTVTRVTSNGWRQFWLLGMYFSYDTIPTGSTASARVRGDDIYFDSTQARVELGNASTWSASTHREIQIPTAWSNTSATFTVNRGSFNGGQAAYVYLVDSNGNVNTNGYPVTISGSVTSDTLAPSAPQNLSVAP